MRSVPGMTNIGDTILEQQAILTTTSLPSLITRLKQDRADIKRARAGNNNATQMKTDQKDNGEKMIDTKNFDAADSSDDSVDTDEASEHETEIKSSIDLLAKHIRDAENVLLRFVARSTGRSEHEN